MEAHTHGEVAEDSPQTPWWRTRSGLVLCGFLVVAGFYLITEHTAHLLGVLPYLLILACPLMHLFHHHGGGHGGGSSTRSRPVAADRDQGGRQ
jgi:hypothetical protein